MRYLVTIAALMIFLKGNAQNVKYKDIAPIIESTSEEYAFNVLKEFLITNLDHPAANLRIADFYINQARNTDPLIEFTKKQALAKQAQQKLFKANILIDEKEVKKNDAYYIWIATRNQSVQPEYEMVRQYIEEEKAEVNKILNSLPSVYNDFTNSVAYYDEAVKEFMEISNTYTSLKNLYFLYDQQLDKKFTHLKSNYDSSLWYFEQYKSKIDTFPLKGYHQNLRIKPINVYRYDGLVSQVNFLKNDVEIWNYAKWVDTVRNVINGEVTDVRKLLNTNEERQDKALESLSNSGNVQDAEVVPVDKSILFNLLRYDYSNPIVSLLKYKESKQRYLIEKAKSTYYDTAQISIERKLIYYNGMLYNIKDSDSLIVQFNNRYDPERMKKYTSFLSTYYGGIDGSTNYMNNEKSVLDKEIVAYGSLLKKGVESIKQIDSIGTTVRYKSVQVPLFIDQPDSLKLTQGALYTTHIIEAPDGGFYVAGVYIPDKKTENRKAYVSKLTEKKSVKWFHQYDVEIDSAGVDSNNSIEALTLTNEGIAILINSKQIEKPVRAITFIHVLLDGTTKIAKRLDLDLFPRELLFDEKQNGFVACLSGNLPSVDNNRQNKLTLIKINSLGEQVWTYTDIEPSGFIGLVKTHEGFLIARNKNNTSTVLTTVDNEGGKTNERTLSLANASINRIYKLNDASIHLLGADSYCIVNSKLEEIYP